MHGRRIAVGCCRPPGKKPGRRRQQMKLRGERIIGEEEGRVESASASHFNN